MADEPSYMVARTRAKVKRKKVVIKKTKPVKKTNPVKKTGVSAKKTARKKTSKKPTKIPAKTGKSKKVTKKSIVRKKAAKRPTKAAPRKVKKRPSNTGIKDPTRRKAAKKAAKKRAAKKAAKKAVSSRHSRAAKKRWRDHRRREKQIKQNVKAAVERQKAARPELAGIEADFKKRLDAETKKAFQAGIRKGRKETIDKERAKYSAAYIKAREEMEEARKLYVDIMAGYIETDESKMMARMILANDYGELDQEAEALAEEYDWDIREVFDLFFETP